MAKNKGKPANRRKKQAAKKIPALKILPVKKMGLSGIAKQIAPISIIAITATVLLTIYFPKIFTIPLLSRNAQLWIGFILLLVGIVFFLFTVPIFFEGYSKNKLVTKGTYSLTRHPIYAVWIVFFIPSLIFFTNSWLFLIADAVVYKMVDLNLHLEETHLIKTFGQKYKDYMKKVNEIFPWPKK